MDNATVPYQNGYQFGMGVKRANGDRMQLGVAGVPTPVKDMKGGTGGFQLRRIETTSDLEDHLGISADASGGTGWFSAKDRFQFSKDCKIQSLSISLLLYCVKMNGFAQIDRPALDDQAGPLVASGSALFAERYGDCFIAGMESGGMFFGSIRIETRSETDKTTMENALSGSYGTFTADVAVKVSKALTQTNSQISVLIYYEGGNIGAVMPQTPDQMFEAAKRWSESLDGAPRPYSALLLPWVIANGPNPPNEADLEKQGGVLRNCAKLRSQTIDRLNHIEYIIDPLHQAEFVFAAGDEARLAALHAAINTDYDMIEDAASFAISNAEKAIGVEDFVRTIKKLPAYTITVLPADLPKRVDGANILVPDLTKLPDYGAVAQAISGARLTIHYVCSEPQPGQPFKVLSQDPGAGSPVAAGATVTVFANKPPLNPRLITELAKNRPVLLLRN